MHSCISESRDIAPLTSLDATERLLIWSVRRWIDGFKVGQNADDAIIARLHTAQLRGIFLPLDALMQTISDTATRHVDMRCRDCPGVGDDEARLLFSIALVGSQKFPPARRLLSTFLPPVQSDGALQLIAAIEQDLSEAHRSLPQRRWFFEELLTDPAFTPDQSARIIRIED